MIQAIGGEVILALAIPILAIGYLLCYYWAQIRGFFHRQLADQVRIEENEQQRGRREMVNDNSCAICLQQPKNQPVSSTCGHSYCGECLWSLYNHDHRKIICPLCRQQMTILFKQFQSSDETINLEERLRQYNRTFDDSRPLLRRLLELPYVFQRVRAYVFRREFLLMFIGSVRFLRLLFIIIFYILWPLDLLPERVMGFFGFIDDILVVFILIAFFLVMAGVEYHRHHQ